MIDFGVRAVATVTAVAVVAVIGAGASSPVVVDEADVQPDHPLYGIERVGESMKRIVNDSEDVDKELFEERLNEFENMAEKGKAEEYMNIARDARERAEKLSEKATSKEKIEQVRNMMEKHIQVLKRVRDNIASENATEGLNTAISNSNQFKGIVENVISGTSDVISDEDREEMKKKIDNIVDKPSGTNKPLGF